MDRLGDEDEFDSAYYDREDFDHINDGDMLN